jgi:hypothetical protein
VTSSADDKRWAIVPPPSPESSASGEFHLDTRAGQLSIGKRVPKGPADRETREREVTVSSIHALEPADSELITERPPALEAGESGTIASATLGAPARLAPVAVRRALFGEVAQEKSEGDGPETIPAPAWLDDSDG